MISGEPGTPPRYAVPDFVALSPDAADIAKTLGQVLWDDLNFEREFYMIPRDTYATIPAARTAEAGAVRRVARARRRRRGLRHGAEDGANNVRVQVRLFNVRSRQSVFAKEYTGTATNPRLYAHTIADEIHQQQRALRGVARTKLTFSSDRNREALAGPVQNRDVKEIYIADYDGANQRRITTNRQLNIMPVVVARRARPSPTRRTAAATPTSSSRCIYQGLQETPTNGVGQNWLPVFSPDGTRIAFTSNRDGNPELYVMNRDGSNVRRITNHPAIDTTPTWSPNGTQIAFTSDRAGTPQIYIIGADGLNLRRHHDERVVRRPADVVAGAVQRDRLRRADRAGYDIKVYDLASGRRGRSRSAKAPTRARPTRRTAGTSRSRRRAAGRGPDLHDRPRRQGRQAGHARRQQLHAGVVE